MSTIFGLIKKLLLLFAIFIGFSIYLNIADDEEEYVWRNYCSKVELYYQTNGKEGWKPRRKPPIECHNLKGYVNE